MYVSLHYDNGDPIIRVGNVNVTVRGTQVSVNASQSLPPAEAHQLKALLLEAAEVQDLTVSTGQGNGSVVVQNYNVVNRAES